MNSYSEHESVGGELFLAGECVLPGTYRQVGGMREVQLDHEDFLPASLDGRVACYILISNTWGQHSAIKAPGESSVLLSSKS